MGELEGYDMQQILAAIKQAMYIQVTSILTI